MRTLLHKLFPLTYESLTARVPNTLNAIIIPRFRKYKFFMRNGQFIPYPDSKGNNRSGSFSGLFHRLYNKADNDQNGNKDNECSDNVDDRMLLDEHGRKNDKCTEDIA